VRRPGLRPARSIAFSLPFESLWDSPRIRRHFPRLPCRDLDHFPGLRIGIVRIPRFRRRMAPLALHSEWTARCNSGFPITADSLQEAIADAWLDTLAAQLRQFQKSGVAAVLVDVGGIRAATIRAIGPHGFSRLKMSIPPASSWLPPLCGRLLRRADPRNPRSSRSSPGSEFRIQAGAPIAIATIERRKTEVAERDCDMSWAWCERRPWNPAGSSRLIEAGFFSGQVDYLPRAPWETGPRFRDLLAATADPGADRGRGPSTSSPMGHGLIRGDVQRAPAR